jgi:hypothetical protein
MWGNLGIWKQKRHSFLDKEQMFALHFSAIPTTTYLKEEEG